MNRVDGREVAQCVDEGQQDSALSVRYVSEQDAPDSSGNMLAGAKENASSFHDDFFVEHSISSCIGG